MGKIAIQEESATPSTPAQGVTLYPTVATPSIFKMVDDAGVVYTFALLEKAQTFTTVQTITPTATGVNGLAVNMPASTTGKAMTATYNSTERMKLVIDASNDFLQMVSYDAGSGAGPQINAGRNSNGSTAAPGTLAVISAGNSSVGLWPDNSGVWRTAQDTSITSANFASAGTVVGTQTCNADFKNITGDAVEDLAALNFICLAAEQVSRFVYKSGAYNGEEFSGLVIDGPELHRYGMDTDKDHPAGKSLNVINAIGDLFKAVRLLSGMQIVQQKQIEELKSEIQELKSKWEH